MSLRLAGATLALALTVAPATALASDLPTGFGPISVGQPWIEIEGNFPYQDLSDASSLTERLAQECGYKHVSMPTENGTLLVTTNDFVVTEVALVSPLEPGSDLMQVADLVMQTYGQPKAAAMRTALGQATIDRSRVNFIELAYTAEHPVTFHVSGATLWEYQISIRFKGSRWHQNKTDRCARQRLKTMQSAAEKKPEDG